MTPEQKEFVTETVNVCRSEVDRELRFIRSEIEQHRITPEMAESIATSAAVKAKSMMTDQIKLEIADASISIIKRSLQVVALFLVGMAFFVGNLKWPWKQ
jgi:hypothetical protein